MGYEQIKLSQQLCHPLYSATNALVRSYAPLLKELDLTYPQYLVMMALWEKDQVNMSALSEVTFFDSGSLTPLIARLKEKGYLRQTPSAEDQRQKIIQLTKKGAGLKDLAAKIPGLLLCEIQFSDAELATLKKLTEKLRKNLLASTSQD